MLELHKKGAKDAPVVLPSGEVDEVALKAQRFDLAKFRPIREGERQRFLLLVSEGFSIKRAAEAVRRTRFAFQELIDSDEEFRASYERAFEASADDLEDEAWRRAHERGRHRLGSDRLLELSLKARRPRRYADRVQVSGHGGGPVRAVVATVDHRAVLEVLADAGVIQRPAADG